MKFFVIALCIANAVAECPNACSGHGSCALHDQCECCRNYDGADCSERICPFDSAHVDTPKGDIDGSTGTLSGPSDTLIVGSNIYPFGTTEQYPNLDANEGHAYMECSNKGLCNRAEGTCDCFPGYEGTACQRASCPNQCSGHGTCETIKELAEDKEDGDISAGAYGEAGYAQYSAGMGDLSGVGNLKYELWDKTLTMGCKCDPGFTGPDCSLKLCRYGVDPLFIPSTHSYSPVEALEDDALSPSAPHYEKAFVEIVAKDTLGYNTPDAAAMSGNFDLVIYDVYGEKYILDKLKYAHFDEVSAGLVPAASGSTWSTLQGVGYGVNHTTCQEIMSYFPNDRIKDTTMGSFQNQMKHRGGLVSTAYVSGTTKPFCSISGPHGQNITTGYWITVADCKGEFVTTGADEIINVADKGSGGSPDCNTAAITIGDFVFSAKVGFSPTGADVDGLGIMKACPNGCTVKTAYAGSKIVLEGFVTPATGLYGIGGATATPTDTTAPTEFAVRRFIPNAVKPRDTTHESSGMSGTFGIRYNFDYNRGNPGYHKDLYVENVIPELGGSQTDRGAYVPVTAFYGVIQQGEVAEYKGDEAQDRPAKTYDVTLPGYITDITPDAADRTKGDTITFSTDLSSYLSGLHDHGTAASNWLTPDHKTNKIKILDRYYMIQTTKRILVTAKVPKQSDYEIGEDDAATNATLGRFVTQAKLIDDAEMPKLYKQYWQANGIAYGQGQTCVCSATAAIGAGTSVKTGAQSAGDDYLTIKPYDTNSGGAVFDGAALRIGMQAVGINGATPTAAPGISTGTKIAANQPADSIITNPKTGTKVYLSAPVGSGNIADDTIITFFDPDYANGNGYNCFGCPHYLPKGHEETDNAATAGHIFNGRVDFTPLNTVYKKIENTQKSSGCGKFTKQVMAGYLGGTTSLTGLTSYEIRMTDLDGIKIGMTVNQYDLAGAITGNIIANAWEDEPYIIALKRSQNTIVLNKIIGGTLAIATPGQPLTFGTSQLNYDVGCANAFDSMVAGKLQAGTDGFTPDVKLTVKAKLTQPYQYVSECSNRGACDRETGLCMCFTGYTHDNCDTQTPVC